METNFKVGDFVKTLDHLEEITEIYGERISVTTWGEFNKDQVKPIKIGEKGDSIIKLRSPLMATYVRSGDPASVHKDYCYLDYKDINDIITSEGFVYVHELQHYLTEKMPGSRLYLSAF